MKEFTLGIMYWLNPRFTFEEMNRDCRNMKENGYTLARIIVWWELAEKKEGVYDFSFVERFFAARRRKRAARDVHRRILSALLAHLPSRFPG